MPQHEHERITFRTLYDSPMISVRDYICRDTSCTVSGDEESSENSIVLMRHGAFSRHFGNRHHTADVNQATFFSKDSVYQVSHPVDHGDRGTTFSVAASILTDIIRELDPTVDENPEVPFPFVSGPCPAEIFWRHRNYVRRLENAKASPLEPLWADITGLQLVADVLEAAFERFTNRPKRRASTAEDHSGKVEAAKAYIAARFTEEVRLEDVANAVNASPFNFARIFQENTGLPIHRYLTLLRLRASLERIAERDADLTSIAHDLGFSSHSHFTDVFRREFGKTPSEIRTLSIVNELSKNLIA